MKLILNLRERALNTCWAAFTIFFAFDSLQIAVETSNVQAFIFFSIHLLVALLFLIRYRQLKRSSYLTSYAVAIASTYYVYLFKFDSPAPPNFVLAGEITTLVGSVLSFVSILSIGRYFGVLPNLRGVQTKYLYSLIRHPIYSSYIIMDSGIIFAYPSIQNLALFALAIALYIKRIQYEELLLHKHQAYTTYSRKVRYKLFPYFY